MINHAKKVSPPVSVESFDFTDQHFKRLRDLVYELTGISMSDHKKDLLYGRLTRRLRVLKINNFDDYYNVLKNNPGDELQNFINAVTTNLTSFFREKHHFECLRDIVIPEKLKDNSLRGMRIWSAGCSTGEEPYSIAMLLRESIPNVDSMDIKILASDLDTNVVQTASLGVYDSKRIEGMSPERVKKWFQKGTGDNQGMVRVRKELRDMITFEQVNLMQEWPKKEKFDVVFCRNVVIYFDKPTQKVLFNRFADVIKPDQHLFIGHSETLHKLTDRFQLIGKTVYRRIQ